MLKFIGKGVYGAIAVGSVYVLKKQKAIKVVILGKEAENFLGLSYT